MELVPFSIAVEKTRRKLKIDEDTKQVKFSFDNESTCKIIKAMELVDKVDNLLLQYILFGQNETEIVPIPWIQASWQYFNKFRCRFGFTIAEALYYPTITIVGTPDLPVAVTTEQENYIKELLNTSESSNIERLWVKTPEELSTLLEERIKENQPFSGGDVGPHAPII
ncbi:MAG TPA: hypothetical protein V6D25_10830 [Leptolyngbyaceae cyanobacterium]